MGRTDVNLNVEQPPDVQVVRQRPRGAEGQPVRQHRHRRDPAAAELRRDGRLRAHAQPTTMVEQPVRLDAVCRPRDAGEHGFRHDVARLPGVARRRVDQAGAAAWSPSATPRRRSGPPAATSPAPGSRRSSIPTSGSPRSTSARGAHTLKFGADLRFLRETSINFGNSAGNYTFGTQWTRGPLDNSAGAPNGQALASFLLGLPTAGQFDVEHRPRQSRVLFGVLRPGRLAAAPRADVQSRAALRARNRHGRAERSARSSASTRRPSNSVTAAARAAYAANPQPGPAGERIRPDRRIRSSRLVARAAFTSTPGDAFSPRIGVAYTPAKLGGNTVFRGGFGIYYHTYGTTGVQRPGFSADDRRSCRRNDGFLRPAATLSNPFPSGDPAAVGAALGVDQNLGQAVTYTNPDDAAELLAPLHGRRAAASCGRASSWRRPMQYNQARGLPINDDAELHAGAASSARRRRAIRRRSTG